MRSAFLAGSKTRSVDDRIRRMAFWGSAASILFNTLLHAAIVLSEGLKLGHVFDWSFYSIILSLVCWCSYKNWHFRHAVTFGAAAIYSHMWGRTFHAATVDEGSIFSLPILLFTPLWLILSNSYRALFFYTIVQSALIFLYTNYFAAGVYGFDPDLVDITGLAIVLAILSATMVTVLAVLSYARKKTDRRLLALIQETERLAAEDPLTGLKNRRAFMQRVEQAWQARTPFAIVFIDLDRFKPINDEYGHAIGDQVLQTIGKRLRRCPELIAAARFGGDEFAAIFPDTDNSTALHTKMQSLHAAITDPVSIDLIRVSVGASVGYARAMFDASSVGDLLHAADTAMMRCKSSETKVAKFDPALDDIRLSASAITEAFRIALDMGNIKPALQPIVEAKSQKVIGYELLARWVNSGFSRDPSPADFIPIAEKSGLLNDLLWSTMDAALPYLRESDHFLSINVSPSQLASNAFTDGLSDIARRHGFSPDRIEIEITENVAFRNLDDNIQTLERLRDLGCRIVLDDFGSGYSSLSLLEELPLDKVKLDRSLQSPHHKRGVLQAAIRLAHDLGFECCVEGIETEHAAEIVRQLGCTQMQGFWFGYPKVIERNIHRLKAVS
ncbi:MAG: EAL domain-containing protein [Pseudomonadota bacterium]